MSMFSVYGKIQWDKAAVTNLLDNPHGGRGTVGAYMRRVGLLIQTGARAMAGVRTGRLRRSIAVRQGLRGGYQYVEVGSSVPHAYVHHEGSDPHEIIGGVGRIMRFNVGGRVVYARKVDHPGTAPRKYLTVPMNRVVRR